MKVAVYFFWLMVCAMQQCSITCNIVARTNKYVIGCLSAGLFSSFLGVVNHLVFCKQHDLVPVVYWDNQSLYFDNNTNNINNNVWEYYFEPVSHLVYENDDQIHRSFSSEAGTPTYYFNNRELVCKVVEEYIHVKPHIKNKVDQFYEQYMQDKKTIGIHLRGTDKIPAMAGLHRENMPLEELFKLVNNYEDHQFFIATDEQELLEKAKQALKGTVIYSDSIRSTNSSPLHHGSTILNKAQIGEQALIDVLLLAKCDHLFASYSNLSFAVIYFNKNIPYTTIYEILKATKNYDC